MIGIFYKGVQVKKVHATMQLRDLMEVKKRDLQSVLQHGKIVKCSAGMK